MPGLFQGLEIGRRALLSQQSILQTLGHNIANVNTPGYSRQRVRLISTPPERTALGQFGSGVTIADIRHVRDLFLGTQYREINKALGKVAYQEKTLTQIEGLFNEPQDNSLGNSINEFWNAFSALSTDPGDGNSRRQVLTKAKQMINGFNQLGDRLTSLQRSLDQDVASMTAEVNRIASEVAQLNQAIRSQELGGNLANDLRDTRDLLIDDLSNIVDVRTTQQDNGTVLVQMAGMALVDGSSAFTIGTESVTETGRTVNRLVYQGTSIVLRNEEGQLAGIVSSRDQILPKYIDELNRLAKSMIDEVNTLHRTGYGDDGSTGLNFFDPNFVEAANMRLNLEVEQDINKIAASSIMPALPGEGDNLITLAIAQLRDKRVLNGKSQAMSEFYNGLVGELGIESREAISFRENSELLLHQIENNRQAVQGVSLDEEMTNMIKAQHAFEAAARVITAMDEAIDLVVNRMGIVGR